MLCPQCRRGVGRTDAYCPEGHLVRPELIEPEPNRPRPSAPPPAAETPPQGAIVAPSAPGDMPPPVPPEGALVGGKPKSRSPRTVVLIVAALVVGVVGYLAFGPSASAANLTYAFKQGERTRYSLVMTFDMNAGTLAFGGQAFRGTFESVLEQRTMAVDKDGTASIEYRFTSLRFTQAGKTTTLPATDALRVTMKPDGRVIDVSGEGLFALGGDNPLGDLSNMFGPEAYGPILPRSHVDPGESWKIDEKIANPFGKPIRYQGIGTLLEKREIGGEEAAVIRSEIKTPFDFRLTFADIAKLAGEPLPGELKGAALSFTGFFTANMTQSLGTKTGFLQSALGDLKMTGTMAFEKLPQLGDISAVFNMALDITMTKLP